ncbi:MAG: serine/threonine protein kinase [Anaerolineae bacterium]|nr:serine/threonine protein kinase [Anaerolineae bacterium]
MNKVSSKKIGDYTLLERIGRGGMSEVYRARSASGQDVALKLLKSDPGHPEEAVFLARFRQEARIIAELDHPHILSMLDYGDSENGVYIVMPLIEGGTLADLIRQGLLSPEVACHWVVQLAAALDHAHGLDVIHRDLKPTNILIDQAGNAYLTDFGIAKLTTFTNDFTETGNVLGTPAYMAPEQWKDEPLYPYTDVYGLGVITYLMLTGHTPFEAESPHAMMYYHLDQQPPPLRNYVDGLSLMLEQVVLRALSKKPSDRYASAGAFAEDFQRALEGKKTLAAVTVAPTPIRTGIQMYPPPPEMPLYRRYQMPEKTAGQRTLWWRWFAMSAALVGLLLLGVGGSVVALWGDGLFLDSPSEAKPTSTSRSLDVPRISLTSSALEVSVGQEVLIQATVYDRLGVTRVELRDGDTVLNTVTSVSLNGEPSWSVEFRYTPTESATKYLEIIAFRGDIASDPKVLSLKVR